MPKKSLPLPHNTEHTNTLTWFCYISIALSFQLKHKITTATAEYFKQTPTCIAQYKYTSMQTQWSAFCPCRTATHSQIVSHSIVCVFIRCVLHKGISSLIDARWVGGGSEIALQSVSILFPAPLSSIFSPLPLFLFLRSSLQMLASIFSITSPILS